MTTSVARFAAIIVLAHAAFACTNLGQIQREKPVRTMKFSADTQLVARCVQGRLGGKLQAYVDGYLVVYDAVKARQMEGITHYSVTLGPGEKGGVAELRIVQPVRGHGPNLPPPPRASAALINEYWNPVVQCTKVTP
jgi:hypothetical protein